MRKKSIQFGELQKLKKNSQKNRTVTFKMMFGLLYTKHKSRENQLSCEEKTLETSSRTNQNNTILRASCFACFAFISDIDNSRLLV